MKTHKGLFRASKIAFHASFVLFSLVTTATPLLLGNAGIINTTLGIETTIGNANQDGNTYFNTKFKSMEEVHKASLDIIEETVKEGSVLLKNNGALPLSKGNTVNLYGAASYYSVHTGMGSSSHKKAGDNFGLNERVTLLEGLNNAGLSVNSELNNWYKENGSACLGDSGNAHFMGYEDQETQMVVKDVAFNDIATASKEQRADVGIMVIARNSGEAVDLYMDTTMEDGKRTIVSKKKNDDESATTGDALVLSQNERDVLMNLKRLKDNGTLSKVVVLLNLANPIQGAFLEEEALGIDACLWVGDLGTNGANAVGKLLTGEYNPSGRLSDTYFKDNKYNPVYYNFGSDGYEGADTYLKNYFATLGEYNNKFYIAYQEGIYNGYRYSETRYEDVVLNRPNTGDFSYQNAVSYPFGYGLSYSTFSYSNMEVKKDVKNDIYNVTLDVENTSDVDGKEAVQIYLQKPYTAKDIANGIEKPSVELVGFTKVDVKAHEKVKAEIQVEGKYFASYDANVEKTYVVGSEDSKDKYLLTAAKDSHDAVNNILQYKAENGTSLQTSKIVTLDGRENGKASLVYGEHIDYDNTTYSTNAFIEEQNENFTPDYEGQKANYGVDKITNQFEDTDYQKSSLFTEEEKAQPYLSRNNWQGTYGVRVNLKASAALAKAQENPAAEEDNVPYPTYDQVDFYEGYDTIDEIKLIYLRGKDYDDPLWDTLLNRVSFDETCMVLQDALRYTKGVPSIAAPSTSQQNGALAPVHSRTDGAIPEQTAFRGFAEMLDPEHKSQKPAVFACNVTVACTYNKDLFLRLGEQTGEEAAWAGYNGIYGLGVNIHRGGYCGRTFEYYSEDGFLTGVASGYEAVGLHKMGVFVIAKHAILNDQETRRAGLNVWANEQSIREIYARALEVAISIDSTYTPNSVFGVMTGMNRLGAKWTGGQGFCNTVLRAEFGMRGLAISDYNSSRPYMNPIQGVLNGNDLPDGNPAGAKNGYDYDGNDLYFSHYNKGYGKLAWAMRQSLKNVLYSVVNSNSMNGITGDTSFKTIVPTWEKVVPICARVSTVIFGWSAALFAAAWIYMTSAEVYNELTLKNKE